MKSFLCLLLLVVSVLAQNDPPICNDFSEGNPIREAFYWNTTQTMFVLLENRNAYVLTDFQWHRGHNSSLSRFQYTSSEIFVPPPNVTLINTQLLFTIEYPGEGTRVVVIDYEKVDEIGNSFVGHIVDFQNNSFTSPEKIEVNPYKCHSTPEPLKLCNLFANLPEDRKNVTYLSITSFPKNASETERLLVYFKELAPKSANCESCYVTKRYVFVNGVTNHSSITKNIWRIDEKAIPLCLDYNNTVVNATVRLTDYWLNPGTFFDLIEFSGTEFTVSLVTMDINQVVTNDNKWVHFSGSIRKDFLNCKSPATTVPPIATTKWPTIGSTQSGKPPVSVSSTKGEPTNGDVNPNVNQSNPVPTTTNNLNSVQPNDEKTSGRPPSNDKPSASPTTKKKDFPYWALIVIVILVAGVMALMVWLLCFRDSGAPQPQDAGQGTEPLVAPNTGATTTSVARKSSSESNPPGIARTDTDPKAAHDSGTDKEIQSSQALTPTSGSTTPPSDTSAITGPDGTQTPPADTSTITGPDGTQTTTL